MYRATSFVQTTASPLSFTDDMRMFHGVLRTASSDTYFGTANDGSLHSTVPYLIDLHRLSSIASLATLRVVQIVSVAATAVDRSKKTHMPADAALSLAMLMACGDEMVQAYDRRPPTKDRAIPDKLSRCLDESAKFPGNRRFTSEEGVLIAFKNMSDKIERLIVEAEKAHFTDEGLENQRQARELLSKSGATTDKVGDSTSAVNKVKELKALLGPGGAWAKKQEAAVNTYREQEHARSQEQMQLVIVPTAPASQRSRTGGSRAGRGGGRGGGRGNAPAAAPAATVLPPGDAAPAAADPASALANDATTGGAATGGVLATQASPSGLTQIMHARQMEQYQNAL